ncbi:MAG: 2-C-methyl-D-erythritol 4-phosphate cytidylyltransferase [Selenomonadaceae bacterium]|nr:2-C-methyl-D-erythritol 4-phosphate cytidylyltransferase [Selenomonadaceae bacterium]
MVAAMFPAAGSGRRMGAKKNKVLLSLDGKPILVHTLRKFSNSPSVDFLVVIAGENEIDEVGRILEDEADLKPYKIVAGGSERQYSVENGLKALPDDAEIVLVHDAARPLVAVDTIEKVISAVREKGAAIAAVPEKNTVKVVENGIIVDTPKREKLYAAQTPQGFKRDVLLNAYEKARKDGFLGTDDSSLVERMGFSVHIVIDDDKNIKLTTPSDLKMAEAYLGHL